MFFQKICAGLGIAGVALAVAGPAVFFDPGVADAAVTTKSGLEIPDPGARLDPFGGAAASTATEAQAKSAIEKVVSIFKYLLYPLAIGTILVSGMRMVIFGDEEAQVKKSKMHLLYATVGLVFIVAIGEIVARFATPAGGLVAPPPDATDFVTASLTPIISLIKYLAAAFAVVMLVVAATRMVTSTDADTQLKEKDTILYALVGLIVVIAMEPLIAGFYTAKVTTTAGAQLAAGAGSTDAAALLGGYFKINATVLQIVEAFRYLLAAGAVLMIVVAGIRMALGQGDEQKNQWQSITWSLVGLTTVLVAGSLVKVFFGKVDTTGAASGIASSGAELTAAARTNLFALEAFEILKFLSIAGTGIAVLMIVLAGIRAAISGGDADQIEAAKKTTTVVAAGLLVMTFANTIVGVIFDRSFAANPVSENAPDAVLAIQNDAATRAATGIAEMAGLLNFVLGFVGAIAVLALIFGGYQLVLGGGEKTDAAKKILTNAAIGLILTISAWGLVATFLPAGS